MISLYPIIFTLQNFNFMLKLLTSVYYFIHITKVLKHLSTYYIISKTNCTNFPQPKIKEKLN